MLICNVARAEENSKAFKWLSQDQALALSNTVPPSPGADSPVDKADLAAILQAQAERTPAIVAECKRYQGFSYKLMESVYGSELTPETNPKLFELLKTVLATTHVVNETAKEKYKRLRPYQAHPDVVKAVFTVKGYSYPSGHSMGSFTLAIVLGEIFPDKKQEFLNRAAEVAQSRVNAGVHYPSDIKAGEVLGRATGAAIIASPSFRTDLAAVKAELKK